MTSSNGNIFRVTGPLCGEFTGPGEFPTQRPVTRSFDVFFDLRLNKRLSKQPWGWWFETRSWSLWRHRNDKLKLEVHTLNFKYIANLHHLEFFKQWFSMGIVFAICHYANSSFLQLECPIPLKTPACNTDWIKTTSHTWVSWLKMEGISLVYSLYPMYEKFCLKSLQNVNSNIFIAIE